MNDDLIFILIEYFRCQSNGRFTDRYNCEKGKYFECIHYDQGRNFDYFINFLKIFNLDGPNTYGALLSRSCPISLRFNVLTDRCDYPKDVSC